MGEKKPHSHTHSHIRKEGKVNILNVKSDRKKTVVFSFPHSYCLYFSSTLFIPNHPPTHLQTKQNSYVSIDTYPLSGCIKSERLEQLVSFAHRVPPTQAHGAPWFRSNKIVLFRFANMFVLVRMWAVIGTHNISIAQLSNWWRYSLKCSN